MGMDNVGTPVGTWDHICHVWNKVFFSQSPPPTPIAGMLIPADPCTYLPTLPIRAVAYRFSIAPNAYRFY